MDNQTLPYIARVMERGLIVIPKPIRKKLGIAKSSYLRVGVKKEVIILKPLESAPKDDSYYINGVRVWPAKVKTKEEALKLLTSIKRPVFSDEDIKFLKKGRKLIEARLKKMDKII